MEDIRNALSYLYCNCNIEEEHSNDIENSLDVIDWILDIIDNVNMHSEADCVEAIAKIKNLTCVEVDDDESNI